MPDKLKITKEGYQDLLQQLPRLAGRRVLVVGDLGLDEYLLGEVRRISPEAPVPVLEVDSQEVRMGLSGNVAQNIVSLGGQVELLSVVGADETAKTLARLCKEVGIGTEHLVEDASRPSTRKARVMAKHHHLVRVDFERRRYLSAEIEEKLLGRLEQLLGQVDVVIAQDYAKGVLTEKFLRELMAMAEKQKVPVLVDPHRSTPLEYYKGASVLKPNYDEALALSGLEPDDLREDPRRLERVAESLREKAACQHLIITQGKEGMSLFDGQGVQAVPTYARQVFDVTGAGDTVIAALALGVAAGLPLSQACVLANFAAGVVVAQVGCVACSQAELKSYIEEHAAI